MGQGARDCGEPLRADIDETDLPVVITEQGEHMNPLNLT